MKFFLILTGMRELQFLGNTMQKGRNLEKRRSSSASADVGCKENEGMRTDE